jgi:hypothetical protein
VTDAVRTVHVELRPDVVFQLLEAVAQPRPNHWSRVLAARSPGGEPPPEALELGCGIAKLLEDVPANENPGLGFNTTADNRAERFRQILEAANVVALIRANRGRDIAAACGQLANVDKRTEPPANGQAR